MCDYKSWLWIYLYLWRTIFVFNYFWFRHRYDISYFPYQLLIIIKYLRNQFKTLFLCFILWNKVKERLDYFVFVFIIFWNSLLFIRDLFLVVQYLFYLFTDINFILGFRSISILFRCRFSAYAHTLSYNLREIKSCTHILFICEAHFIWIIHSIQLCLLICKMKIVLFAHF